MGISGNFPITFNLLEEMDSNLKLRRQRERRERGRKGDNNAVDWAELCYLHTQNMGLGKEKGSKQEKHCRVEAGAWLRHTAQIASE